MLFRSLASGSSERAPGASETQREAGPPPTKKHDFGVYLLELLNLSLDVRNLCALDCRKLGVDVALVILDNRDGSDPVVGLELRVLLDVDLEEGDTLVRASDAREKLAEPAAARAPRGVEVDENEARGLLDGGLEVCKVALEVNEVRHYKSEVFRLQNDTQRCQHSIPLAFFVLTKLRPAFQVFQRISPRFLIRTCHELLSSKISTAIANVDINRSVSLSTSPSASSATLTRSSERARNDTTSISRTIKPVPSQKTVQIVVARFVSLVMWRPSAPSVSNMTIWKAEFAPSSGPSTRVMRPYLRKDPSRTTTPHGSEPRNS